MSSLELADHKPAVTLKEFEKVGTKKERAKYLMYAALIHIVCIFLERVYSLAYLYFFGGGFALGHN
jgi:hypothetical protein